MGADVKPFEIEWEYRDVEERPTVRPRRRRHAAIATGLAGLAAGFGLSGMMLDRSAGAPASAAPTAAVASAAQPMPDPGSWPARDLPSTPDGAERWLDGPRLTFDVHDLPNTPDAAEHWLAGQ
jgi:hypothetical protein